MGVLEGESEGRERCFPFALFVGFFFFRSSEKYPFLKFFFGLFYLFIFLSFYFFFFYVGTRLFFYFSQNPLIHKLFHVPIFDVPSMYEVCCTSCRNRI